MEQTGNQVAIIKK